MLQALEVPVDRSVASRLADGSEKPVQVGYANIRLAGSELITPVIFAEEGDPTPDRGRYFFAMLMTLISDGARSMLLKPENSALARSRRCEEPMPGSRDFQRFIPNFGLYIPLSETPPSWA